VLADSGIDYGVQRAIVVTRFAALDFYCSEWRTPAIGRGYHLRVASLLTLNSAVGPISDLGLGQVFPAVMHRACKTGLEKGHELGYLDGIVESNHRFWQYKLAATKNSHGDHPYFQPHTFHMDL
jgi:hypothetical protein